MSKLIFSEEIVNFFLELYPCKPKEEVMKELKKKYPEVAHKKVAKNYWEQLARRRGIKVFDQTNINEKINMPANENIEKISVSNPEIAIPDYIEFAGARFPVNFLRAYYTQVVGNHEPRYKIFEKLKEIFPSVEEIKDSTVENFFKYRLELSSKIDFGKIPIEEFEKRLLLQQRRQLIIYLFFKKWRKSIILEKAIELFPTLEAIDASEIDTMVSSHRTFKKNRRKTYQFRQKVKNSDQKDDSLVKSKCRLDTYYVELKGPDLSYIEELTKAQARTVMKYLLNIEERTGTC